MTDETTPTEAIGLMRSRGIDDPESLLSYAEPDAIARTCQWWDSLKGVGKGLLVSRIRSGGIPPDVTPSPPPEDKATALRRRFDELTSQFPVGSVAETHASMQARRWPGEDDHCPGRLVVLEASFPSLVAECDVCEFNAAYPLRALAGLPMPDPGGSVGLAHAGTGRPLLGLRKLNPLAVIPKSDST